MPGSVALERASAGPAPSLDDLSRHWRVAFDVARDALQAVSAAGLSAWAPGEPLGERTIRLAREQQETASVLDALAREERVRLRRRLSAPPATLRMLGLPSSVHACIFDLDGVLTASAELHAAAWADALDEYLWARAEETRERNEPFLAFDARTDYMRHLHGKPRLDGVRDFLASRGMTVPDGHRDDPAGAPTAHGIAKRKNVALRQRVEHEGVSAFEDSRSYLEAARDARLRCAVVSASANTELILQRAGLADLIAARVDGSVIRDQRLSVKPAPDTLLTACRHLGVAPREAAAFETTDAGLEAAREAGIGFVVAVDRTGRTAAGRLGGAGIAVHDLRALLDPALQEKERML